MLRKIRQRLAEYEGNDKIDKWYWKFQIGLDFENFRTVQSFVQFHETLKNAACGLEKTKLLTFAGIIFTV